MTIRTEPLVTLSFVTPFTTVKGLSYVSATPKTLASALSQPKFHLSKKQILTQRELSSWTRLRPITLTAITKHVSPLEDKHVRRPWHSISCHQRAPRFRPAGGRHSTKCPAGFLSVVIILTTLKKDMIFPPP